MSLYLRTALMVLPIFIAACEGGYGGSGRDLGPASEYAGLWIDQDAAVELRKTGRLNSFCNDIGKGFDLQLVPARLISRNGDVFMYDPSVGAKPEFKIGSVSDQGKFQVSGIYKVQSPGSKGYVEISEDKKSLSLVLTQSATKTTETYLRSTEDEIQEYFKAQQSCR